ncbi:MAG TPA: MMPL family transporter [Bacteroidia bacterium]|jgi:predicted RND superfamily exporter protein|nr:MMPL family transporter [Bacteroidia bacterium]
MWKSLARIILRNRIKFLILLGTLTVFLGYFSRKAEISYEFPKLLPSTDSTDISFEQFKKMFGQDGTVMVIGIADSTIWKYDKFCGWYDLTESLRKVEGVQEVVSIARLYNLKVNDSTGKFEFKPILSHRPINQAEVDSIRRVVMRLPFYENFAFTKNTASTVIAVTFEKRVVNTKERFHVVDEIKALAAVFGSAHQVPIHYSGLPYIRSVIAKKISHEMFLFMGLAVLVTAIILFVFFRSILPVVFSLLVVGVGVAWGLGGLVLFGYKITALTGLIPPLIIVIGVPNCILLLNKYHTEFARHNNKGLALLRMIEKIGPSLFFANVTTSIGFAVFCLTHSKIMIEFGLVSSLNVMATYLISIVLIPIIFSYLPPPSVKHTRHLDAKRLTKLLLKVDTGVHRHRIKIYAVVIGILIVSVFGIVKIKTLGYVVDDLPAKDPIYDDLHFFEKNFKGVLPLEISIDTRKENGVFADNADVLYRIDRVEKMLREYPIFSKPISVAEGVKFSNQAMNDGKPKYFRLPGADGLSQIKKYSSEARDKQDRFKAFLDSTKRYTRISIQMADIGSIEMKKLVSKLQPRVDSALNYDDAVKSWLPKDRHCDYVLTGTCLMFLKGNDFLVENLVESVGIAVILITLVMLSLFMSFRMVVISVVPSLVPLFITAALMGFFNIHLKPSTILVFSIAFGISSDGTMYFLTKYRQELKNHQYSISRTVSLAIRETGVSMIYTAVILFCGFGIFMASDFGGTAALGILVSITLLVAYCSNLLLLPCFLLSLEKRITNKAFMQEPLVQIYDEDEDVEQDDLQLIHQINNQSQPPKP